MVGCFSSQTSKWPVGDSSHELDLFPARVLLGCLDVRRKGLEPWDEFNQVHELNLFLMLSIVLAHSLITASIPTLEIISQLPVAIEDPLDFALATEEAQRDVGVEQVMYGSANRMPTA